MSKTILTNYRSNDDGIPKPEASGPLSLVRTSIREESVPSFAIAISPATILIIVTFFLVIVSICLCSIVSAASSTSALQKAKQEAEAKGYTFFTSHDEVVARAKKEGRLRVIAEMEPPTIKATTQAFMQKYPFIKLEVEELSGTGATQTNILQVKAGAARNWDILHLPTDFYGEYIPHIWKMDVLGMAQHGVIQIPAPMIDPEHRGVVAFNSRFQVAIYNKSRIPTQQLPKLWEDVLKPEFKGKKFAADIRPTEIAALVPAWGLEKTLDFARKVAAQEPIWVRGSTRTIPLIIAGEVPMMIGPSYHTTRRIQKKILPVFSNTHC